MNKELKNKKEITLKEIKENGLLLSFDYSSTPFWFMRNVPHIKGQNIPESHIDYVIGNKLLDEINKERRKWLNKISKGKSEWDADFEHRKCIEKIGEKISNTTGIKVFMYKLNNIKEEHYTKIEIKK